VATRCVDVAGHIWLQMPLQNLIHISDYAPLMISDMRNGMAMNWADRNKKEAVS
jgi:hypothetical protein